MELPELVEIGLGKSLAVNSNPKVRVRNAPAPSKALAAFTLLEPTRTYSDLLSSVQAVVLRGIPGIRAVPIHWFSFAAEKMSGSFFPMRCCIMPPVLPRIHFTAAHVASLAMQISMRAEKIILLE